MNRAVRALVGVAALLVGAAVVATAPEQSDVTKPIDYRGAIGDRVVGRAFATTVTRIRFADELRLRDGRSVETPGIWLVVDLRETTRLAGVSLRPSTVRVGDVAWAAYDDPGDADFSGGAPEVGITEEGSLAFEVPARVRRAAAAELVLSRGALNPDQQNVVAFEPRRMPAIASAETEPRTPVTLEFPWGR